MEREICERWVRLEAAVLEPVISHPPPPLGEQMRRQHFASLGGSTLLGLQPTERNAVIAYAVERLGLQYDLRNIIDLARYLISHPPVPRGVKRRMVALGSGDPTRAICSSLIAQAFQSVGYPILPYVDLDGEPACSSPQCYAELLHIRHHSLFTPRDFDISPYFEVIKPTLVEGFEHHRLRWAAQAGATSVRIQAGASGAGT